MLDALFYVKQLVGFSTAIHVPYFPYPVSRIDRSVMSTLPDVFMSALGYEGLEDVSWLVVLL